MQSNAAVCLTVWEFVPLQTTRQNNQDPPSLHTVQATSDDAGQN